MLQLVKKYLEIETCFNQIYMVKFAQMHNLAKKSRKEKRNGTRLVRILIFSQDN